MIQISSEGFHHISQMCSCLCNQNGILLDFATAVSRATTNGMPMGKKTELEMDFSNQNSTYSLWQVAMGSDCSGSHLENASVCWVGMTLIKLSTSLQARCPTTSQAITYLHRPPSLSPETIKNGLKSTFVGILRQPGLYQHEYFPFFILVVQHFQGPFQSWTRGCH